MHFSAARYGRALSFLAFVTYRRNDYSLINSAVKYHRKTTEKETSIGYWRIIDNEIIHFFPDPILNFQLVKFSGLKQLILICSINFRRVILLKGFILPRFISQIIFLELKFFKQIFLSLSAFFLMIILLFSTSFAFFPLLSITCSVFSRISSSQTPKRSLKALKFALAPQNCSIILTSQSVLFMNGVSSLSKAFVKVFRLIFSQLVSSLVPFTIFMYSFLLKSETSMNLFSRDYLISNRPLVGNSFAIASTFYSILGTSIAFPGKSRMLSHQISPPRSSIQVPDLVAGSSFSFSQGSLEKSKNSLISQTLTSSRIWLKAIQRSSDYIFEIIYRQGNS